MPTPTGFTALIASRLQDAGGNPLTGTLDVLPTDANDVPVNSVAGGVGGPVIKFAAFSFTAGVLAPNSWVPDSALTTNAHTSYRFTFTDASGAKFAIWKGVQPTGATFSLDSYQPNVAPQAIVQIGPTGPQGVSGVLTGNYVGPLTLSALTVSGPATLASVALGAASSTVLSPNAQGYQGLVIADAAGHVLFAIDANGHIVGTLAAQPFPPLGAASITVLSPNAQGYQGLVIADAAGRVLFAIDQKGHIVGTLAAPPSPAPATDLHGGTARPLFGLNVEIIVGESTACGNNTASAITLSEPFANLTFSHGVRCGCITSYTLAIPDITSNLTAFTPLTESLEIATQPQIAGAPFGETALNGICDRMTSDLATVGLKPRFLAATSALPGAPYSAIAPGTTMYAQLKQIVQAAVTVAGSTYGSVGVLTLTAIFGINDDAGSGNASFYSNMVAYQAQAEADIKTITGQTSTVPMILMQPNRWGSVSPARAVNGLVTPVVAPQQVQLCLDHPAQFFFSTPVYFMAATGDGIHFPPDTQRWLGEYIAETKVAYQMQLPLPAVLPLSAHLIGNTVVVAFSVVNGPLVFDTGLVSQPTIPGSLMGFEVFTSSGTVVPILAARMAQGGKSVTLLLGSSPTGGSVAYAWSAVAGELASPTSGARGNLRDSNPASSFYGYPNMFHWAPTFKLALS